MVFHHNKPKSLVEQLQAFNHPMEIKYVVMEDNTVKELEKPIPVTISDVPINEKSLESTYKSKVTLSDK